MSSLYADIIVPLALPQLYTYSIPDDFKDQIQVGKRVVVQFGAKKIYTGLVRVIHNNKPQHYKTKFITTVLDNEPIVNEKQLEFWDWIASYYLCTIGEVFKAALPSGLKLESETKINYNSGFDSIDILNQDEAKLFEELHNRKTISVNDTCKILDKKNTLPTVNSLLDKGAINIEEKLKEKYKPKTDAYIKLTDNLYSEDKLHKVFNNLNKAPKQLQLLMIYIQLSDHFNESNVKEVQKTELLKQSNNSAASLTSLIKKEILEIYEKETGRLQISTDKTFEPTTLNEYQKKAYSEITEKFKEKDIILLHGVTSSGKTEIYIHLIQENLDKGKQILYLLPEIALTTQIISRLKQIFGNKVGVYHSKFSDSERVEVWQHINQNSITNKRDNDIDEHKINYQIILGARSSIFLPFDNLGLIIVDEEHENTYKQFDPAPRYNARDSAMVLAKLHGAKVLLGTATPAIESYYNTKKDKYALVEILHRYKDIKLPEIIVTDIKEAKRKKQMKSHFSPTLLNAIKTALDNDEQIILFQNRRGFSPYVECKTCGWIPKCDNCDVSLTYHKNNNLIVCHYCGHTIESPPNCLACGDVAMQTKGFGTEKIEDELPIFFKDVKVARMDLDTTRTKNAYQKLINDFETKKINILIGTQMISKGLDFDNVSLVGIMDADSMLNYPDFRAFERSYQLMAQVSGRAGRKNKRGKVIIQTSNPENAIIQDVIKNDYKNMYLNQITERYQFKYPPFYRLILITLKHKKSDVLDSATELLAERLKKIFGNRMLGPEYPPVGRIQNWFLKNILLKIEKEKSVEKAKRILLKTIGYVKEQPSYSGIIFVLNADPM